MKKMIILFIGVFVVFCSGTSDVFATKGISVFFVNGMFNDRIKAEKSLSALKSKLEHKFSKDIDIEFKLAYNYNEAIAVYNPTVVIDDFKEILEIL